METVRASMFLIIPKRTQRRNHTTEVLPLKYSYKSWNETSSLPNEIRKDIGKSSLSGLISPKTAQFSCFFFLTGVLGSFENICNTAEQSMSTFFGNVYNKNTAFAGTQSSRLTSLCLKFGLSPRDRFEVERGSYALEKSGF